MTPQQELDILAEEYYNKTGKLLPGYTSSAKVQRNIEKSQELKESRRLQELDILAKEYYNKTGKPLPGHAPFSLPKYLGQEAAKGASYIADLPGMVADIPFWAAEKGFDATNYALDKFGIRSKEQTEKNKEDFAQRHPKLVAGYKAFREAPSPSQNLKKALKETGIVDLDKQVPRTIGQELLGHGANWVGATTAGSGIAKAIKTGTGIISGAKNYLRDAPKSKMLLDTLKFGAKDVAAPFLTGVTAKSLSKGAQELGVPEVAADIGSDVLTGLGAPWAYARGKQKVKKIKAAINMSTNENKIAKNFIDTIKQTPRKDFKGIADAGEQELAAVKNELSAENVLPGYTPSSAEKANNFGLSQIERTYSGTESGVNLNAERNHAIRQAIADAIPENVGSDNVLHYIENNMEKITKKTQDILNKQFNPLNEQATASQIQEALFEVYEAERAHRAASAIPSQTAKVTALENKLVPTDNLTNYVVNRWKGLMGDEKKQVGQVLRDIYSNSSDKTILNVLDSLEPSAENLAGAAEKLPSVTDFDPANLNKQYKPQAKASLKEAPPQLNAETYDNATRYIDSKINMAKKAGNDSLAAEFSRLKELVQADLQVIPESAQAKAVYTELSRPVNTIERSKVGQAIEIDPETFNRKNFQDFLKKEMGAKYETSTQAEKLEFGRKILQETPESVLIDKNLIPNFKKDDVKNLFNYAIQDEKTAKRFLNIVKDDPKTLQKVKGVIDQRVIDLMGKDIAKFNYNDFAIQYKNFVKTHPGVETLYPELTKKIDNLKNSRTFFADATKNRNVMIDDYYNEQLKSFLHKTGVPKTPQSLVSSIFESKNSVANMRNTMDLLQGNPNAKHALKRNMIDYLFQKSELTTYDSAGMANISRSKFNSLFNKKDKIKALELLFSPNEMKLLKDVNQVLKMEGMNISRGATQNSSTFANVFTAGKMANSNKIFDIGLNVAKNTPGISMYARMAAPGLRFVKGLLTNRNLLETNQIIKNALTDPKMLKFLITQYENDMKYLQGLNKLPKQSFFSFLPPSAVAVKDLQKFKEKQKKRK